MGGHIVLSSLLDGEVLVILVVGVVADDFTDVFLRDSAFVFARLVEERSERRLFFQNFGDFGVRRHIGTSVVLRSVGEIRLSEVGELSHEQHGYNRLSLVHLGLFDSD